MKGHRNSNQSSGPLLRLQLGKTATFGKYEHLKFTTVNLAFAHFTGLY